MDIVITFSSRERWPNGPTEWNATARTGNKVLSMVSGAPSAAYLIASFDHLIDGRNRVTCRRLGGPDGWLRS